MSKYVLKVSDYKKVVNSVLRKMIPKTYLNNGSINIKYIVEKETEDESGFIDIEIDFSKLTNKNRDLRFGLRVYPEDRYETDMGGGGVTPKNEDSKFEFHIDMELLDCLLLGNFNNLELFFIYNILYKIKSELELYQLDEYYITAEFLDFDFITFKNYL